MADADIQLAPDGTGKLVDAASLSGTPGTVHRQRVSIGDDTSYAAHAGVLNSAPAGSAYGLVVRPLNYNYAMTIAATSTPLTGAGTFTQTAIDLGDLTAGGPSWSVWRALVSTDQPGTLNMQQSANSADWDAATVVSVAGSTPVIAEDLIVCRYLRVNYVNGATNQTVFRVNVRLVASQ